jgi:hypothetical protein
MGLADAGVADRIVSVSSVSGGSIANGVLAASAADEWTRGPAEAEVALAPGLRQWAHDGLFFPGKATDGWVAVMLGLLTSAVAGLIAALAATVAVGREWSEGRAAVVALALLVALGAVAGLLVWRLKTRAFVTASVIAGAVLIWPFTYLAIQAVGDSWLWLSLVWLLAIALLAMAILRFGRRSEAAVSGLEATLFPKDRTMSSLDDRSVHHVLCAANLRTGNNLYLTNKMLWGHGSPAVAGEVTLATAVQASACLPGAFLARTIERIGGDGSPTVVLSDGGAYDNMADQWEWGFPNRREYAKDIAGASALLQAAQRASATHLVVVNASRGMTGTNDKVVKPGLRGELASVLGAKDVLYDVSTATRRRLLIEMFDRIRKDPANGRGGILIHIGTSPYTVVDKFKHDGNEVSSRAVHAEDLLDVLTDLELSTSNVDPGRRRQWWIDRANENATVKTTLGPLEGIAPGTTAKLLHHAWVLTRITGHIVHAWGTLPDPAGDLAEWRCHRFDELVEQTKRAPTSVGGV